MWAKSVVFSAAVMASVVGYSAVSHASATYPSKPIRVIVPYAAGGVVDVQTRAITDVLQSILKQPVVIEAKPGASGGIAARFVASAKPDGYTLIASTPFLINNPLLGLNTGWEMADFSPIARFSTSSNYFVVPANSPAKTVKEFAELALKAEPMLQYGNGGIGTSQTMFNELFRVKAGIGLESVMYKGAPPIVPDLMNGLIDMAILPSSVSIPQIKAGGLRALANTSDKRSVQLPDVPTIAEAGYPEVTAWSWLGMHAPKGTPQSIIDTLENALLQACDTPEFKERIVNASGEEACMSRGDFEEFLAADAVRWKELVEVIQ